MDLSDDIAYSVHDIEDGVVGGWFSLDPPDLDLAGVLEAAARLVRRRDQPTTTDSAPRLSASRRCRSGRAARSTASRESRAVLKSLTSALIGRFVTRGQAGHGRAHGGAGRSSGTTRELEVPAATRDEITALKSVAAHYVMRSADRTERTGRSARSARGPCRGLGRLRRAGDWTPSFAPTSRRPPTTPLACASSSTRSPASPTSRLPHGPGRLLELRSDVGRA